STLRIVWSGMYEFNRAQSYYRLTVTFNPKNLHIRGKPDFVDKWEYREVNLFPDEPLLYKRSLSRKILDSTVEARNVDKIDLSTPFDPPCRPTLVKIHPIRF